MPRSSRKIGASPAELPQGYTPPADPEAEQSVLGAILVRPESLEHIVDIISMDDFYREAHGRIFQTMIDLYNRKEPIDLVTVTILLRERSQLESVGGPIFLSALSEQVGFATNIEFYAKKVLEKAKLRRLLDTAQGIVTSCFATIENVDEFIDTAEEKIFRLSGDGQIKSQPLSEIVIPVVQKTEELYVNKSKLLGIPTGFYDLDRKTAGLQNSDLFVLAARPSQGKTALSGNIAFHVANKVNIPVAYFSLEMSKSQLVQRLISAEGNICYERVRSGSMINEEWVKFQSISERLLDAPLFIDDRGAMTPMQIRAEARRLKMRHGIGLVIIDYLQLMRFPKAQSREREIGEISGAMKALAKELNIPIMLLSQLNRKVEERNDKHPMLSDLRDSGSIEQDADVVAFIYRDEVYNENTDKQGIAEIIIGKQRNGPTGTINLAWQGDFVRFENLYTGEEHGTHWTDS